MFVWRVQGSAMMMVWTHAIDVIHFPNRNQVQIFWLHPTGEMAMENLTFENIRINGEVPYNLIKLTPALNLVGTRPIKQPTPNNVKVGPGRRGIGSRGYGEFVVVPSNGPFIHNVTFKNICTYGGQTVSCNERGTILLQGVDEAHDVSNITFDKVSYFGNMIDGENDLVKMNEYVKQVRFIKE